MNVAFALLSPEFIQLSGRLSGILIDRFPSISASVPTVL